MSDDDKSYSKMLFAAVIAVLSAGSAPWWTQFFPPKKADNPAAASSDERQARISPGTPDALQPARSSNESIHEEPSTPDRMFERGRDYELGRSGAKKNESDAVLWYRKAAELGNASAQNNLADMYYEGRGGLRQDKHTAMLWYTKAAEHGDASAQFSWE